MASVLKVDKLDPQSGTALEIGTSGDTITVPSGATLDISASTLTPPATMPASSGINFTALNATNLGSGTVPTARLGTGTASSSTVLYGDQTYKAEPGGGKILQVVNDQDVSVTTNATTSFADSGGSIAITPSATSSLVLVHISIPFYMYRGSGLSCRFAWQILRGVTVVAGDTVAYDQGVLGASAEWVFGFPWNYSYYDNPSTTSETTYKCQFKNQEAGTIITQVNSSKASMTALEIDGS